MRFSILLFVASLAAITSIPLKANSLLQAGPMVGAAEMREATLWLQTSESAEVKAFYWPKDDPTDRRQTQTVQTRIEQACTATLTAGPLEPGTQYEYAIVINDRPVTLNYPATFQTLPDYKDRTPPPDFKVAVASGNYVNDAPYDPPNRIPGGDYHIYLSILATRPNMMLWLGNHIYLREADWNSRSGILARYTQSRSTPELQPLLASVHHVGIWGEHDFGAPGADKFSIMAPISREAFLNFWPHPPHGLPNNDGLFTYLRWSDVDFFILDDRTFRNLTPQTDRHREILGETQLKWLIESLRRSQATFKVVVMSSPILNPGDDPRNFSAAPGEREKLLDAIKNHRINGVLFISGGRDHGELTKMVWANAPDMYDATVGVLTGRPASDTRELNYFRVPGTTVFKRHFALLEFSGPENNRQVTLSYRDADGNVLWTRTLEASQMRFN